mgnify:CR=1 FL=1
MVEFTKSDFLLETTVLLAYFIMFGLDMIPWKDAVVIGLWIIAAILSRHAYTVRREL